MQHTVDYFKPGAVAVPLRDGIDLVITRVNDDVSNAHFARDDRPIPIPQGFSCLNRTSDSINPPYKDGWLLSWASTYSISCNAERVVLIECQRSQRIITSASVVRREEGLGWITA